MLLYRQLLFAYMAIKYLITSWIFENFHQYHRQTEPYMSWMLPAFSLMIFSLSLTLSVFLFGFYRILKHLCSITQHHTEHWKSSLVTLSYVTTNWKVVFFMLIDQRGCLCCRASSMWQGLSLFYMSLPEKFTC